MNFGPSNELKRQFLPLAPSVRARLCVASQRRALSGGLLPQGFKGFTLKNPQKALITKSTIITKTTSFLFFCRYDFIEVLLFLYGIKTMRDKKMYAITKETAKKKNFEISIK